MGWVRSALDSSIGGKIVSALTGALLLGFVVAHLTGNLLVFKGPAAMNAYAKWLHDLGPLLWVARIGLLGLVVLHIVITIRLNLRNRAARPVQYAKKGWTNATWASRNMVMSGLVVLAFIVYHLLHFTLGVTDPEGHASQLAPRDGLKDVYGMVVLGFQSVPVSLAYVVAMSLLGLHLAHGASSFLQTLGVNHPRYNPLLRSFGPGLAGLIVIGYLSIPVSVLLGIVR